MEHGRDYSEWRPACEALHANSSVKIVNARRSAVKVAARNEDKLPISAGR
ncbi:hypothetical protein KCP76_00190 [Salmonella enterica subsp. enterica serovar Weltevreden]|nr:hypothetical protein KCP76_00190 [Salmonella enterica subsp. enterica serovar Weltevreden]